MARSPRKSATIPTKSSAQILGCRRTSGRTAFATHRTERRLTRTATSSCRSGANSVTSTNSIASNSVGVERGRPRPQQRGSFKERRRDRPRLSMARVVNDNLIHKQLHVPGRGCREEKQIVHFVPRREG